MCPIILHDKLLALFQLRSIHAGRVRLDCDNVTFDVEFGHNPRVKEGRLGGFAARDKEPDGITLDRMKGILTVKIARYD